jgi:putative ABC transport system ATP-binding protein
VTGDALIDLERITKTYGQGTAAFQALKGVDLSIAQGEFAAIMGASGSGKSTMMNILGCLDTPTTGVYRFKGVEVQALSKDQRSLLRRRYLGFVFQGFNLLARTSARAMATRCCWPPESSAGVWSAHGPSPTRSSAFIAASRRTAFFSPR